MIPKPMESSGRRPLDVCCVGDLCVDLILRGDVVPRFHQEEQLVQDYALELGGSATIFASQFVKLGGRAGLVGAVGEDAFGATVRDRLEELGIGLSAGVVSGDRHRKRRHESR